MAERSWFWGGTVTGDAALATYGAPYTDDVFTDVLKYILVRDNTTMGVVSGLEVTVPAGTTLRMASGFALVDGKLYQNTDNLDFSLTPPVEDTNYYTLVLRKDFATQTVRAVVLGPSTVTYPAVTQTDGVIWEIAVGRAMSVAGVLSPVDINYSDLNVQAPIGRVVLGRQGGSATSWIVAGSTSYPTTGKVFMQCGATNVSLLNNISVNDSTITFPTAFDYAPLVLCSFTEGPSGQSETVEADDDNVTATGCTITVRRGSSAGDASYCVAWLAIGPG